MIAVPPPPRPLHKVGPNFARVPPLRMQTVFLCEFLLFGRPISSPHLFPRPGNPTGRHFVAKQNLGPGVRCLVWAAIGGPERPLVGGLRRPHSALRFGPCSRTSVVRNPHNGPPTFRSTPLLFRVRPPNQPQWFFSEDSTRPPEMGLNKEVKQSAFMPGPALEKLTENRHGFQNKILSSIIPLPASSFPRTPTGPEKL